MNNSKNPLSPHLQIYRWQVSSLVSIIHIELQEYINLLSFNFNICVWLITVQRESGKIVFEFFSINN